MPRDKLLCRLKKRGSKEDFGYFVTFIFLGSWFRKKIFLAIKPLRESRFLLSSAPQGSF